VPRFARGRAKTGGRHKGTPNKNTARARRLISEADDAAIVKQTVTSAKAGDVAAMRTYYQYLRPPTPRSAFAVRPFELRKPTTLEEAAAETLRIADAVARGELDHDTATILTASLKAFCETMVAARTVEEEGRVKALEGEGGSS
jgi:hypothetical protein